MILIKAKPRGCDDYGCGHFGASRGKRVHKGVDYCTEVGDEICANVTGRVSKLGYTYSDDLSYRYVEITDAKSNRHRFYYVSPSVRVGDIVNVGETVGCAQDIAGRYTKNGIMKNHVHYEIIDKNGEYVNPEAGN